VSLGFAPEPFWGLTFRLFLTQTRGALRRLEREHAERAWHAWMTAALPRMKVMPDLRELISPRDRRGDVGLKLALLSAALPKITQAEWRARKMGVENGE
jgi:hypothetical protein